jgi:hypothetical protein
MTVHRIVLREDPDIDLAKLAQHLKTLVCQVALARPGVDPCLERQDVLKYLEQVVFQYKVDAIEI